VLEEQVVRVDLTESIKDVLTEQRELTAQVLESVMKTNTKIANNVAKHVKASADTNAQLVEAINALTEKMSLLETKLEAIENLEIPTPIVQVNSPSKKVEKIVHRDNKGFVTHITESEVFDDGDE
jgi:predicted metal-dependent hydrolase